MNRGYPDVLLTSNFHMQVSKGHFGEDIPPKFCPQWKSPKITKTAKNGMFHPEYPFWWACMVKIIANYVWNEFRDIPAQKVLIKKKFSFLLEKPWFLEKYFEKPKIHFFGQRNPVGWACHVLLALNHWKRPKNGGRKKCTGNVEKCSDMAS